MQIGVIAESLMQAELQDKQIPAGVRVDFYNSPAEAHKDKDAYLYLLPETALAKDKALLGQLPSLVFVNAVYTTLDQLPGNCVRLCAWPGFLLHETIEVVAAESNSKRASEVLGGLHIQYQLVPDEVGMIAPRVVASIINEAYYLLEKYPEKKAEIDAAIVAGVNAVHGPVTWCEKIGKSLIFTLLSHLQQVNKRYEPAPLLNPEN